MAEYCLDCVNKIFIDKEKSLTKKDVVTHYDLCEGCGTWKECVIVIKKNSFFRHIFKFWRFI